VSKITKVTPTHYMPKLSVHGLWSKMCWVKNPFCLL
jgi:hypothetical protein